MSSTAPISNGVPLPDISGIWNSGPIRPLRRLYENDKAAHDIAFGLMDRYGVARSLNDSGTVLNWSADLTGRLGDENNLIQNMLKNTGNALKAAASPDHQEMRKGLIGLPISILETLLTSPFHGFIPQIFGAPSLLANSLFIPRFGGCLMDFAGQITQWAKLGNQHSALEAALGQLQKFHPDVLKKLIQDTSTKPLKDADFIGKAFDKTRQDYLKRVHKLPKAQLFELMEQPVFKALNMNQMLAGDATGFVSQLQKAPALLKAQVNGESLKLGVFDHIWSLVKVLIEPFSKLLLKAA